MKGWLRSRLPTQTALCGFRNVLASERVDVPCLCPSLLNGMRWKFYATMTQKRELPKQKQQPQVLTLEEEEEEQGAPLAVLEKEKERRIGVQKKKKKSKKSALAKAEKKIELDPETGEPILRERIAKRLARSGVCSRRDAEDLILKVFKIYLVIFALM